MKTKISYTRVIDFCKEYNMKTMTRFEYFMNITNLNMLFNKKYSFLMNVWLFIGQRMSYLKTIIIDGRKSYENSKKIISECFSDDVLELLNERIKEQK